MNPSCIVALMDPEPCYAPGDIVEGIVRWSLTRLPRSVRVELFWTTNDPGFIDAGRVTRKVSPITTLSGEWAFDLVIPPSVPPSYNGRLVKLCWLVQAVIDKRTFTQVKIVVSPTGESLKIPDFSADKALQGR